MCAIHKKSYRENTLKNCFTSLSGNKKKRNKTSQPEYNYKSSTRDLWQGFHPFRIHNSAIKSEAELINHPAQDQRCGPADVCGRRKEKKNSKYALQRHHISHTCILSFIVVVVDIRGEGLPTLFREFFGTILYKNHCMKKMKSSRAPIFARNIPFPSEHILLRRNVSVSFSDGNKLCNPSAFTVVTIAPV